MFLDESEFSVLILTYTGVSGVKVWKKLHIGKCDHMIDILYGKSNLSKNGF